MLVKEFALEVDLPAFYQVFWLDSDWYANFLTEQLQDLNVEVGDWNDTYQPKVTESTHLFVKKSRVVTSFHPSNVSFPGLPSHAESIKRQEIIFEQDENGCRLTLKETNEFKGIPYSDYFTVNTEWSVTSSAHQQQQRLKPEKSQVCYVSIFLEFIFIKSTWLQGTIESNAKSELITVYDLWHRAATEFITTNRHLLDSTFGSASINKSAFSADSIIAEASIAIHDIESGRDVNDPLNQPSIKRIRHNTGNGINVGNTSSPVSSGHTHGQFTTVVEEQSDDDDDYAYEDDDDLTFYDCEEVATIHDIHSHMYPYSNSISLSFSGVPLPQTISYSKRTPTRAQRSGSVTSMTSLSSIPTTDHNNRQDQDSPVQTTSVHELAVSVVETVFVMFEFTYWRMHGMYHLHTISLFDVTANEVFCKALFSVLPGFHTAVLRKPDLYGPALCVMALPLVLLWSLQMAPDSGCSSGVLLGHAIIASLCLWLTLTCIYRLLSLVLVPWIEFRHCLSVIGYSFFPWVLALLLSQLLETWEDLPPGVPAVTPLLLLGLPAAFAQGAIFWDVRGMGPTGMSSPATAALRKSQSQSQCCALCVLPCSRECTGCQTLSCLSITNGNWSLSVHRMLLVVPKLITFMLVAGTHYQFLWYLARVFLPGRQQSCHLSALLRSSQYADILTQKEYLKYATQLLHSRGHGPW